MRSDGHPAALDAIARLSAAHGPLVLFQSGGCCDGSSPICLEDGELPSPRPTCCWARSAARPFYIDGEQYERWGRPDFLVDVAPGAAEGFSLGAEDLHFVTRTA